MQDDNPWGNPANVESTKIIVSDRLQTDPPLKEKSKAATASGSHQMDGRGEVDTVVREEDREITNSVETELTAPAREDKETSESPLSQVEGPPMDVFPDEEQDQEAEQENAFGDEDEFGDEFGEMGGNEGDDDDFGDFGEADETIFESIPSKFTPEREQVQRPALSSTAPFPPLQLDFTTPTAGAMAPQLAIFFEALYPGVVDTLSQEQERQVDGVGQVLVSESLRTLLASLSSLPPLKPVDWRRSRIRREHLIALGVPVNLDDSSESKPLASLVLPSQLSVVTSRPSLVVSPTFSYTPTSRPITPAHNIPNATSPSAHPASTVSLTSPTLAVSKHSLPPEPPMDKLAAAKVLNISGDDLSIMSLAELEMLSERLERIRGEASMALEYALLVREKETGDTETYNGMIQDLVLAASRMKTTTRSSTPTGSRWSRKAA